MSESSAPVLYALTGICVVVAFVAVFIAARAQRAAREAGRDYQRIANADSDVVDVLLDRISGIDAATKTVEQLAELIQATRDDVAHSLRHVAVVRYDAFRDLSGRLSFSVALLDDSRGRHDHDEPARTFRDPVHCEGRDEGRHRGAEPRGTANRRVRPQGEHSDDERFRTGGRNSCAGDSVAFLGPAGTFTEVAMRAMPSVGEAQAVPLPTVDAVLDAVRSGEVSAGVVPIENSLEGPVTTTPDALARDDAPLVITEEWALPVRFALLVRPGVGLADIKQVASIPIAAAQCRNWLAANLPDAHVLAALSTASAAQRLGTEEPPPYDAAISLAIAAEHYGLDVLTDGIGDNPDASTRFVQVRRPGPPPARRVPTRRPSCCLCARTIPVRCSRSSRNSRCVASTSRASSPARRANNLVTTTSPWTARATLTMRASAKALTGLRRVCANVRYLGPTHAMTASSRTCGRVRLTPTFPKPRSGFNRCVPAAERARRQSRLGPLGVEHLFDEGRDAVVGVSCDHVVGTDRLDDPWVCILNSQPRPRPLKHRQIVRHIPDRHDVRGGDTVMTREGLKAGGFRDVTTSDLHEDCLRR